LKAPVDEHMEKKFEQKKASEKRGKKQEERKGIVLKEKTKLGNAVQKEKKGQHVKEKLHTSKRRYRLKKKKKGGGGER